MGTAKGGGEDECEEWKERGDDPEKVREQGLRRRGSRSMGGNRAGKGGHARGGSRKRTSVAMKKENVLANALWIRSADVLRGVEEEQESGNRMKGATSKRRSRGRRKRAGGVRGRGRGAWRLRRKKTRMATTRGMRAR
jgi:hypothetical protein